MLSFNNVFRRASLVASVALASVLATGCLDDGTGPEEHDEPQIAAITVSPASGSAVTGFITLPFTDGQAGPQSGTLTLRANVANSLTVRVLDLAGNDDAVVEEHPDEFQIRVLSSSDAVLATSTSSYPYTISLTPTQVGSAAFKIQVFAVEHGHPEVTGSMTLTVAAQ